MGNNVFLDGLSLTLLGVPQHLESERDFISNIAVLLKASDVQFRDSGAKGYPLSALITGTMENGFEWTVFCSYGSKNIRQHMNIEAKGQITEQFRDHFLSMNVAWSLTRADIAMDMIMDYDQGHAICQQYSERKKISTSLVGDWEGRINGRTYYIGKSRSSSESYIRFYEKGIEMTQKGFDGYPPDLVRLELEYKPRKEKRQHIEKLEASYLLSFATNPLELFTAFVDLGISGVRIQGTKNKDYRSSALHMVSQYANIFREWEEQEGINSLLEIIRNIAKDKG